MLYLTRFEVPASGAPQERARTEHQMARRLLLYAMGEEYGLTALPEIVLGPWGKPAFREHPAKFSLAHTRGLACCALSDQEIGVDAERIRPYDGRLAERICTEEERAAVLSAKRPDKMLMALWCLKESLMKLTGRGMAYGFQNAAFSFDRDGHPRCHIPGVYAALFEPAEGFITAACGEEPLPGQIHTIDPAYLPDPAHIY